MHKSSRRRRAPWLVVPLFALVATVVVTMGGPAAALTPAGALDEVSPTSGQVTVAGWSTSGDVHFYVDGGWLGAARTGGSRPDVTAALGLPGDTGYRASFGFDRPGSHTLCAYGFEGPSAVNPLLGCRDFLVGSSAVQGSLDAVRRPTSDSRAVEVHGWSTTDVVHVYANGRFAGVLATGGSRPDVLAAVGARDAGFAGRLQIPDAAGVCAYAVGGTNPLLGCTMVLGPTSSDPAGHALALINRTRADAGVPPLRMDAAMSAFALGWSQAMPQVGFRHSGGPYPENVAWWTDASLDAPAGAARLHALWLSSPGHLRQMTDPRFTRVGIGLYRDPGGWYGTLVFQ